jgi:hypothetical protein
MTKDEALRLALEYVELVPDDRYNAEHIDQDALITAIKAALEAKDEPEYYGLTKDHLWMSISKEHYDRLKPEFRMACYTTPPQRPSRSDITWVGLTNDEVNDFAAGCHLGNSVQGAIYKAEAKLKEKNT